MNIAAHSAKFAKEAGIKQSVAQEFHAADKAQHATDPRQKLADAIRRKR